MVTDAERAAWARSLRALAPFDDAELAPLGARLVGVDLARGEHFLSAGSVPLRVGVIAQGVLREAFVRADGTERTRSFAVEGDLAGSLADLLRGGPARTLVVAEEDARVLCLPWSLLQQSLTRSPTMQAALHRVTERLYLLKSEREHELLALDAEGRYHAFRARFPGIEARVTQRHVASYLGITPEHLSRLRGRARRG
jgi:CRP-like cAMP-binding protein